MSLTQVALKYVLSVERKIGQVFSLNQSQVVTGGLSVRMGNETNVGVFTRYRDGEVDSTALAASLES